MNEYMMVALGGFSAAWLAVTYKLGAKRQAALA
jgi:hypothetical protein